MVYMANIQSKTKPKESYLLKLEIKSTLIIIRGP